MSALTSAIASAARSLPAKAIDVISSAVISSVVVVVRVVAVVVGIVDTAPARVR